MRQGPWSHPGFPAVLALVEERAGLAPPSCPASAEEGISRAMARAGVGDFETYRLRIADDAAAMDDLLTELTIGETYFFRTPEHFEHLRRVVLPTLRERHGQDYSARLWSAACSSGEEPYSLAALLMNEGWSQHMTVLATDVSRTALARARRAHYGEWSLRGPWAERMRAHLRPEGRQYILAPEVKQHVRFSYLNLALDTWPSPDSGIWRLDVVFCRNVLIYFNDATIEAVARRLHASLAEGGCLFTGPSDPPLGGLAPLEPVLTEWGVFYRRLPPGTTVAVPDGAPFGAHAAGAPHDGYGARAPHETWPSHPGGGSWVPGSGLHPEAGATGQGGAFQRGMGTPHDAGAAGALRSPHDTGVASGPAGSAHRGMGAPYDANSPSGTAGSAHRGMGAPYDAGAASGTAHRGTGSSHEASEAGALNRGPGFANDAGSLTQPAGAFQRGTGSSHAAGEAGARNRGTGAAGASQRGPGSADEAGVAGANTQGSAPRGANARVLTPAELSAARRALERGEWREAATRLGALDPDPDIATAAVRAIANLDAQAALYVSAEAATRHPLVPGLRYLEALLLLGQGRLPDAERAVRQALYLEPTLAVAWLVLGRVLRRLGDHSGAQKALREAETLCEALPPDTAVPLAEGERARELARAARDERVRMEGS
ncbi:chemotaxis protein CheR [Myxococcus sp. K38C18041901]|uniref:CheR family methyltransferase n=1 Tax=Myxococcus guangdongensis TaxID=2906760 RepID=UPI0020A71C9B|nr:CheR family methyltransferase [Myxococcus guangdongensis]MCP3059052.1 chemotaxis protein CheR [Myxococcus guangdongensis]